MKKHNMKKTMNPIGTIAVLVGLFGLTQGADSCFDVVLTTAGPWGEDISWSVGSCESNQIYPSGPAPTNQIFTQECCLPDGDYIVTCSDSWGDGWAGSFLEINGQKHCEDFPSGDEQLSEVSIGGQPVNCQWSAWTTGTCSRSCGGGQRMKTRTKTAMEQFGGTCGGQASLSESCNSNGCPVNCQWSAWMTGTCSKSCGGGQRMKTRTKMITEQFGGTCGGQASVSESCNSNDCPVNCQWSAWTTGTCSRSCGGGQRMKTRTKMVTEQFGGTCGGQPSLSESCNMNDCPGESPSLAEYEAAKGRLRDVLVDGGLIPVTVRLAFHDCVGPRGCDGCLSDQPDNNGLAGIVSTLTDLRNQGFPTISNADFWQIAGITALEEANSDVDITFKGGRVDCSPGDDTEHSYPEPSMNRAEMMAWFQGSDGFDMSEEQVTALMGAHSLGRTTAANSGYNGAWTPGNENIFNNEFYQMLTDDITLFSNVANVPSGKFQWNWPAGNPFLGILLNTDVELAYDIDVDSVKGTQCSSGSSPDVCEPAPTKGLVEEYAVNEPKFLEDFKEAYELMMTAKTNGATLTEPQ